MLDYDDPGPGLSMDLCAHEAPQSYAAPEWTPYRVDGRTRAARAARAEQATTLEPRPHRSPGRPSRARLAVLHAIEYLFPAKLPDIVERAGLLEADVKRELGSAQRDLLVTKHRDTYDLAPAGERMVERWRP